jgi:choline kinase
MKAIILAAGLGSRLGAHTERTPKCLLPLRGAPLAEHQLARLADCGVSDVTVVTGFQAVALREALGSQVRYQHYPGFAETNNLHTLHECRELLDAECLILFSDVLLGSDPLHRLVGAEGDVALLVDTSRVLEGTMRIRLRSEGVVDLGGHIPVSEGDGNFVGIAKLSAAGATVLSEELGRMVREGGHEQAYWVRALPRLRARGVGLRPVEIDAPWLEIDTPEEYRAAASENFYLK